MNRLTFLALAATLALAACGAPSTPDFVTKAATSDMYEIEAGNIATAKGQSDAVKQFGQHMVAAHSATTAELKAIVTAEKLTVEMPAKLDAKHQALIDDLTKAAPADFDKLYAKQQVDGHEAAVKLFKGYAKKGDNQALKQFAAKTLPTIEKHLEMAKTLPDAKPDHTS